MDERPSFHERLYEAIQNAAPALGSHGMMLALSGLTVGLVCVITSIIALSSSFGSAETENRRHLTREVIDLDSSSRQLMRHLYAAGDLTPEERAISADATWATFQARLDALCQAIEEPTSTFARVSELCARRDALLPQITREIGEFARSGRPLANKTLREVLAIRDIVNTLSLEVARESDALVAQLVHDNNVALAVLVVSTAAFLVAGIVLVVLVVRISLSNLAQSRKAQESAELLRETLDVLPAGVVVYDGRERLMLFNEVAADNSPALRDGNAIGRSYEEMARDNAARLEAAGHGPQPIDLWLERFRSRRMREVRETLDGRLFEWSERGTPSGRTVGLRVDVTEREKARAEYALLVDSLSDMIVKIDAETSRIIFANEAAAQFFGLPRERLVGASLAERVDPGFRSTFSEGLRVPFKGTGRSIQVRFRMIAADGALRHVEARYRRSQGGDGRILVFAVLRDIEDGVRMERRITEQVSALERARREYRSLVDSLNDVVFTISLRTGKFVFAGAQASELLGVPEEQLLERRFLDFVAAEDQPPLMDCSRRALRTIGAFTEESRFRMIEADGALRHVESRVRKTVDEQGNPLLVGVLHDIEERVQLERRLDEERARLRSIVESSGAMMVLVDADLAVTMVNSGFTGTTGIAEADAIGRRLADVIDCPIDPAVISAWRSFPLDAQRVETAQFAVKLNGANGKDRLIAVTATPVADGSGRMASIVLLGVDETARREAEAALHDVERFATVGEMAAMMAHEISQPLQVINLAATSAVEELRGPADEEKGADLDFLQARLTRIGQQVETASRVVGDFRAFVRGVNTAENVGLFDPGFCIDNAIDLTAYGLRQAGIEIETNRSVPLPLLSGEPGRLEQVLVNLVNNARDAGGKTISITAEQVMQRNRPCLRLVVDDSGPGIPADLLPRLFVSFVTTKSRGKGTGLGLRICRRIVEELGGTINAANRAEGGARFEIVIPGRPAAAPASEAAS